jgi:hypothetical protein
MYRIIVDIKAPEGQSPEYLANELITIADQLVLQNPPDYGPGWELRQVDQGHVSESPTEVISHA